MKKGVSSERCLESGRENVLNRQKDKKDKKVETGKIKIKIKKQNNYEVYAHDIN